MKATPTIRFSAELAPPKTAAKAGSQAVLPLPKGAKLPAAGETTVEGTINAYPFQSAIEPDPRGGLRLKVSRRMLEGARAEVGSTVTTEIMRVGGEVETRVPAEFTKALAAVPRAKAMWEKTTPLARRDWVLWISTAKLEETRQIRFEKGCDMLAHGKKRICCFPGMNWLMKHGGKARKK